LFLTDSISESMAFSGPRDAHWCTYEVATAF
jgi:hypothetical protein